MPFDIPNSWLWVKLPQIGKSELGKTLNGEKDIGKIVPYLCSVNVYWNGISLQTVKHTAFNENDLKKYNLLKNDLLICEGGESGRCFVWDIEQEMYYQNALHRVRFYDKINPHFFKYVIESYHLTGLLEKYCSGVTIKHLVKSSLNSIYLPLPPIKEQNKIVKKIHTLFKLLKDED